MTNKLNRDHTPLDRTTATVAIIYSSQYALCKQKINGKRPLQIDKCREHCKSMGYTILAVFGVKSKHSTKEMRMAQFQKMLRFVKAEGKVVKVVVYTLDQFAWSGVTSLESLNTLLDHRMDIEIASISVADNAFASQYKRQFNRLIFYMQRNKEIKPDTRK